MNGRQGCIKLKKATDLQIYKELFLIFRQTKALNQFLSRRYPFVNTSIFIFVNDNTVV